MQIVQINDQPDNPWNAENADNQAVYERDLYRENPNEIENVQHNRADDTVFQQPERQFDDFHQRAIGPIKTSSIFIVTPFRQAEIPAPRIISHFIDGGKFFC